MNKQKKDKTINSNAEEPSPAYIKKFSSQEEADRYNMITSVELSDMEKFRLFCEMLRREVIYNKAKIYNYKDIK